MIIQTSLRSCRCSPSTRTQRRRKAYAFFRNKQEDYTLFGGAAKWSFAAPGMRVAALHTSSVPYAASASLIKEPASLSLAARRS